MYMQVPNLESDEAGAGNELRMQVILELIWNLAASGGVIPR